MNSRHRKRFLSLQRVTVELWEITSCDRIHFFWAWGQDMTLRSKAKSFVGSNKVKLVLTDESELWLQNASDQPVELGPCELFGFKV